MPNSVQLKHNGQAVFPVTDASLVTPMAGTTAQRPESAVTGMTYFDTTLGKPVWFDGTNWIEGGGSSDMFVAEYGVTTKQEIIDAYNAGKTIVSFYENRIYWLQSIRSALPIMFTANTGTDCYRIVINQSTGRWETSNVYPEATHNKVSTISGNETNTTKYPNTKAVADYVSDIVGDIETLLAAI